MITEKVKELLESRLNEEGITIDNVEYFKERNNNFLRITLDKEDAMDVETCVKVTKIINPILDKEDIIKDSYILDVTTKEKGDK